MRKPVYCNNCGKQGHVYNQCKMPIMSIGLIVFRKRKETNQYEYLMIRRKDSLGYVDFIRGNYSLQNKQHILNLLEEMTKGEREQLLNPSNSFNEIWRSMWGRTNFHSKNHYEEQMSKRKFDQLRNRGVSVHGEHITLETLFDEIDTKWVEPEWGFPKGRRNYQERDLMCGFREFEEETGFKREHLNIISNLIPYEEVYTGSNYKTYKHKYFIALYENSHDETDSFQKSEVSKMEWKTLKEAKESIRPYSKERLNIIQMIDTVLNKYPFVV